MIMSVSEIDTGNIVYIWILKVCMQNLKFI